MFTDLLHRLEKIEKYLDRRNSVLQPITSEVTPCVPAWTTTGTAPVLGNGVLTGKYQIRGKMCLYNLIFVPGTTTTYGTGNWAFSLPFPASNDAGDGWFGICHIRKTGVANYERFAQILAGATTISIFTTLTEGSNVSNLTNALPWAWAHDGSLQLQIEYEMA